MYILIYTDLAYLCSVLLSLLHTGLIVTVCNTESNKIKYPSMYGHTCMHVNKSDCDSNIVIGSRRQWRCTVCSAAC